MDSASVSMGLGLITLSAARMAQSGASLVNVMDEARQAMSQVHIWGIFDTLKYILQGGRLGKAKVLLGNLINVKPMLTMRDGLIQPTGFVRTRLKGIDKLIDNFKGFPDIGEVGIVHSNNLDEARSLKARISSVIDRSKIYISRLGPALGVHGGPGTLIIAMKEQASISGNENQALETNHKLINLPSFHKPRLNIATRQ
jgi:DegV family protein with EDD domain